METERQAADIEVEHMGFNDDQLKSYVRNAFRDAKLAESLLTYIEGSESIQKIVHIPVHLDIVCTLWEDDSTGVREALRQGSLSSLYRECAQWIWNRYTDKQKLQNTTSDDLFNMLGKIALNAFKESQTQISQTFINKYAKTERARSMLKDTGLLQCIAEQSEDAPSLYQFAHKTFQEYFAGRWLAIQFLADEDTREQCQKFLDNYKYDASYGQTLLFFSGELHSQLSESSSKHRCNQLSRLLEWLNSEPKEVVGLQHALLQANMLREWLCLADPEEHGAFVSTGSQVVDNLQKWLSKKIKISYFPQGQRAVEQLMDEYWDSKDPELARYIVAKLQQTPLVIRPSQRRGYNEEAALYLAGGGFKVWRGDSEEIVQFKSLLASELAKDQESFHTYSHGEARQAVSFYERALAIYEQVYHETLNHPDIASTLNNLGAAWRALGDERQAVSFYERALAIYEQVYQETPNHPDIASTLNNLGEAWRALGDTRKALSFLERTLAIYEQVHAEDPNHPDIASTLNNLGGAWNALGDESQTVSLLERFLAIYDQVHKEDTNQTGIAATLYNLGNAWYALGDNSKAVIFLEYALQRYKNMSSYLIMPLMGLSKAWYALGDARKADNYHELAERIAHTKVLIE